MRRNLMLLAAVEALDVAAFVLVLPGLRRLGEHYGISNVGLLLIVGVYPVAAIAGGVLLQRWSARAGRKAVLVGAGLLMAEALFVQAWAGDVYMFLMARTAAGFAAGDFLPAALWQAEEGGSVAMRWKASAIGAAVGLVAGTLASDWFSAAAYLLGAAAAVLLVMLVALLQQPAPFDAARGVDRGPDVQ